MRYIKKFIVILSFVYILIPGNCFAETLPYSETVLQTIAMESGGESLEGQAMVAKVIINRAMGSNKSLEAVCKAPKQFSAWNSPKWAKAWLRANYTPIVRQRALKALNMALQNTGNPAIKHYHTKNIKPYWAKGKTPTLTIGAH